MKRRPRPAHALAAAAPAAGLALLLVLGALDVRAFGGGAPRSPLVDTAICWIAPQTDGCNDYDGDGLFDMADNCLRVKNRVGHADSDSDGYGNACDADFDNDGLVDLDDYRTFMAFYLDPNRGAQTKSYFQPFDLTDDGWVNTADYLTLYHDLYGRAPGPIWPTTHCEWDPSDPGCAQAACGTEVSPLTPPIPFSNQAVSDDRCTEISAYDPTELALLDGACGETDPSGAHLASTACTAYSEARCIAEGYATGLGARDDLRHREACLRGAAFERLRIDFVTAPAIQAGCSVTSPVGDDPVSLACVEAIDGFCLSQSGLYIGGFGPLVRDVDGIEVACLRAKASHRERAFIGLGGCDLLAEDGDVTQDCSLAVSEYCQNVFGQPGIGPMDAPGDDHQVDFVCLDSSELFVRNGELPRSPLEEGLVLIQDDVRSQLATSRGFSNDGRLFLRFEPCTEAPLPSVCVLAGLNLPELLTHPLGANVPAGESAIAAHTPEAEDHPLDNDAIYGAPGMLPSEVNHKVLCDRGSDLLDGQGIRVPNPRPCDATGATTGTTADTHDCYDVSTVVSFNTLSELWSTPITAVVENPKTPSARVVDVTYRGLPQQAVKTQSNLHYYEPSITADGRLIVMHSFGNLNDQIVYSYVAEGDELDAEDLARPDLADWPWPQGDPCDASAWHTFKRITKMYDDPYLDDYPVARYPVRDMENQVIDGGKLFGAYPWIDREGRVISFAVGGASLVYDDGSGVLKLRYPVAAGQDPIPTSGAELISKGHDTNTRIGRSILGEWTHGKLVPFDNRLNLADFGLRGDAFHYDLVLYRDDAGDPVDVTVGSTTAEIINSAESRLSFLPNMRSTAPRDVAWHIQAGDASEEIVFDDGLFPNAYIVSPMYTTIGVSTTGGRRKLNDGFEYESTVQFGIANRGQGYTLPARIANTATAISQEVADLSHDVGDPAVLWDVPAYGKLLGGARVEPVAAGGIRGRGLWLDGEDDRLEYQTATPTHAAGAALFSSGSWFYALSIDRRGPPTDHRERLLTWPDGSWLDLEMDATGAQELRLGRTATVLSVAIPSELALVLDRSEPEWGHVALLSEPNTAGTGYRVHVYWRGFLLHVEEAPAEDLFRMGDGLLTVGWAPDADPAGFLGWVDELKAIAHRPGPEEVCNHAWGTLVAVSDVGAGREGALYAEADAYDAAAPGGTGPGLTELEALLGAQPGIKYACERRLPEPSGAAGDEDTLCYGKQHVPGSNPSAASCVRDILTGGSILADAPRVDSRQNDFCTTCHTDHAATTRLDIEGALLHGTVDMPDDPRRQPFQHEALIFGNIPEAYFLQAPFAAQAGLPTFDWPAPGEDPYELRSYEDGVAIDVYTTPSGP